MGVWDRDYSKTDCGREVGGIDWRSRLPPRGTLILIGLHLVGFLIVRAAWHDGGEAAQILARLRNDTLHPGAVLLHPFGNVSFWMLALVVYAIWALGGRIESRLGAGRLLGMYALGTLLAGVVFLGFAQLSSEHSAYALDTPAGALAAWALAAWRTMRDEMVSVFGKLMTTAKLVGLGAAIVVGLIYLVEGPGATGWLIAAAAGSLAWPATNLARQSGGVRAGSFGGRRREAASGGAASDNVEADAADAVLDEILAKISREGIDALTPAEHHRLEAARRAKLRRGR